MAPRKSQHKRVNSAQETPTVASKRARRQTATQTTTLKSKHFDHGSSDEELSSFESPDEEQGSDYDEEAAEQSPSSASAEELESDFASAPEGGKKPIKNNAPNNAIRQAAAIKSTGRKIKLTSKELRRGVKTGLGPGTQVIFRRPKAREAGGIPYTNGTIHPNTFSFLADLAENNNRGWLKNNDQDYRTSLSDFNSFAEALMEKLIEIDETVPELPLKDIVFKLYRDVRFSKDQTPYKTAFSAAWSRTGRKGVFAKYYVQIKPKGGSLVAGGLWMPEAQFLAALRADIDQRPQRLKQALMSEGVRREFLEGVEEDEGKAMDVFIAQNSENALKTKPKGFDADHKDVNLLRLRSFTIRRRLNDDEILGPRGMNRIAELMTCLVPFITYLNKVVMPDDDDDDNNESESGENENENEDEEDEEEQNSDESSE